MKVNLEVPQTLRAVKLSQWQKYHKILEKNKDNNDDTFLNLKTIEIFCNTPIKDIHKLPVSTIDVLLQHITSVLNTKCNRVDKFSLKGTDGKVVHFGLIPNLDKMTYGEYEDLERYIYDEENLHRAMAVLYRPISFENKQGYLIHDYNGTDFMAEVMRDTPLDVVFGARVFFYNLAKKLGIYTLDYTLQQLQEKEENQSDNPSERNGEDIKQSILSQREMLERLMKLQDFHYTNV
jgi:hypothetical protein